MEMDKLKEKNNKNGSNSGRGSDKANNKDGK